GKIVDKVAKSQVTASKVECIFTGVYADVKGTPGSRGNVEFGEDLNRELTDASNNLKNAKGIKLTALGANPFSIMNGTFNKRDAASALLRDCARDGTRPDEAKKINAAPDTQTCGADGSGCSTQRDI